MAEIRKCKECAVEIHPLEQFPGCVCLECWAKAKENEPLVTADELTRMWGGKA